MNSFYLFPYLLFPFFNSRQCSLQNFDHGFAHFHFTFSQLSPLFLVLSNCSPSHSSFISFCIFVSILFFISPTLYINTYFLSFCCCGGSCPWNRSHNIRTLLPPFYFLLSFTCFPSHTLVRNRAATRIKTCSKSQSMYSRAMNKSYSYRCVSRRFLIFTRWPCGNDPALSLHQAQ